MHTAKQRLPLLVIQLVDGVRNTFVLLVEECAALYLLPSYSTALLYSIHGRSGRLMKILHPPVIRSTGGQTRIESLYWLHYHWARIICKGHLTVKFDWNWRWYNFVTCMGLIVSYKIVSELIIIILHFVVCAVNTFKFYAHKLYC
jgi:hypothetical protein